MDKPEAVIFDLGGTILKDTFDLQAGCEALLSRTTGREIGIDEYMRAVSRLDAEVSRRVTSSDLEYPSICYGRLLRDLLGIDYPFDVFEEERVFWNAASSWRAVQGVSQALELIKAVPVRMAVFSNITFGSSCLLDELENHKLAMYFEAVVSSADYGMRKPATLVFEGVCGRLGVEPERSWYIGDRIDVDVRGAQNNGMTGVWFNEDRTESVDGIEADLELHSWDELAPIVSRWH